MDIQYVNNLSKSALLNLFDKHDKTDEGFTRNYLTDVFYDFNFWPFFCLKDFWLLRRVNRLQLTNFCFGNGMMLETLIELISFYHNNNGDNKRRMREITDLWKRLIDDPPNSYYFYSMEINHNMYFNGRIRINNYPGNPVVMGCMFRTHDQEIQLNFKEEIRTLQQRVQNRVQEYEEKDFEYRRNLAERAILKDLHKSAIDVVHDVEKERMLSYLKLNSIDELFEEEEQKNG